MPRTPPRPPGTSAGRAIAVAAITGGALLALFVAFSLVTHVLGVLRMRRAMREAVADVESAGRVVVPSTPAPTAPATAAPAPTGARLSARELAKQSLPGTVSLRCNDSIGSGFFVEPELVMTNAHVLCPAGEKIQAVRSDGVKLTGETVHSSQSVDLALVKFPGARGTPLPLGDVSDLALGDRIMMIGSPVGLAFTVHEGLVSHIGRVVNGVAFIQLDAKVNPGNSGGPIIDEQGRVVGIVTLKQAQAEGIGLAVPINYAYSPVLAFVNPPSAAAATSETFKALLASAGQDGGLQLPPTEGVAIDVLPLLAGVGMDEYRRLVVRVLKVQDTPPGYQEIAVKVWSASEPICTLKGDVFKWKEVDPDKAGSGVPDDMLRALKKLGAVHIFMGEAAMGLHPCNSDRLYSLELELLGGNPISNRMYLRTY